MEVGLFKVCFPCHCLWTESFPSFPRSGKLCLPCDSWVSSSTSAQPALALLLARQSPLASFKALLSKLFPSLPLQLCACFRMEFLWGEKEKVDYHLFYHFFLKCWIGKCMEGSLWVVLLFNHYCLNMAFGRGYLNTISWADSKNG